MFNEVQKSCYFPNEIFEFSSLGIWISAVHWWDFRTIPLLAANCCRVGYLFWAIIEVLKKILIKPFSDSLAWVHFRSPWYKITYFSNQGLIDLQQSIFWIIGPFLNYFCNTQWIQIFHNIFLYIFIILSMILRVTFFLNEK